MTAAHERISRMFNMGDYGRRLAQELLDDHVRELVYEQRRAELLAMGFEEVDDEEPAPPAAASPNDCPGCQCFTQPTPSRISRSVELKGVRE
ncbi:hypothetical protein [Streptomyces sp. NPDC048611]|uniref:hypothetical protein n=1 Tax=Streptomyces sp. NPDC048611 TaxID=3155635 RepID=UPI003438BD4F